jgi:hypothetical protein
MRFSNWYFQFVFTAQSRPARFLISTPLFLYGSNGHPCFVNRFRFSYAESFVGEIPKPMSFCVDRTPRFSKMRHCSSGQFEMFSSGRLLLKRTSGVVELFHLCFLTEG